MNIFSKIAVTMTALLISASAMAVAPKLMVLPDKSWCISKGYTTKHERNGKTVEREDYDRALVDPDFKVVKIAVANVMSGLGYPLVDALEQGDIDDEDEMLDEAFEGAQSGSSTQTNAFDEIIKRNKPDITLKVGWKYNDAGSTYNVTYTIEAVDAYSAKSIAPVMGSTGPQRKTTPLEVAIAQTAKNNMDEFCELLNAHFDDIEQNGREIRADIRIVDNGDGINMNSEFGGTELSELLDNWMNDNTVRNQYNTRSSGRNMKRYDQVRIPLEDARGRKLDATGFMRQLQKYLKGLGIVSEERSSGLGAGRLYIGEK